MENRGRGWSDGFTHHLVGELRQTRKATVSHDMLESDPHPEIIHPALRGLDAHKWNTELLLLSNVLFLPNLKHICTVICVAMASASQKYLREKQENGFLI